MSETSASIDPADRVPGLPAARAQRDPALGFAAASAVDGAETSFGMLGRGARRSGRVRRASRARGLSILQAPP
jgi:hypothetical protein